MVFCAVRCFVGVGVVALYEPPTPNSNLGKSRGGRMRPQIIKLLAVEFVNDEDGLTMVEYAVAGALVSAAVVLAFATLGMTIAASIERLYGLVSVSG